MLYFISNLSACCFTILSSQGFGILREILTSSDIVGVANKETCVLCVYSVYVLCERASVFLIKTIKGPFSVTWLQTGRKCKHKM